MVYVSASLPTDFSRRYCRAVEMARPEFNQQKQHNKAGHSCSGCNPNAGEAKAGDSFGLAGQPIYLTLVNYKPMTMLEMKAGWCLRNDQDCPLVSTYERTIVDLRTYCVRSSQSHRMKGQAEVARKNKKSGLRYLCICCIQCYSCSHNTEASQVPANRWIDRQIGIYLYDRMLLSFQRTGILTHE